MMRVVPGLRAFLLALSLSAALASCAAGGSTLRVQCNVPEASVLVDDVLVGRASEWAKTEQRIRAGFRRVEIRHPGYYPVYAELDLREGGDAVVKAEMRPVLE